MKREKLAHRNGWPLLVAAVLLIIGTVSFIMMTMRKTFGVLDIILIICGLLSLIMSFVIFTYYLLNPRVAIARHDDIYYFYPFNKEVAVDKKDIALVAITNDKKPKLIVTKKDGGTITLKGVRNITKVKNSIDNYLLEK